MPTLYDNDRPVGLAAAVSAYLIWGFSPVYWKSLQAVPAFEILMHRIVWSFVFLAPLVLLQHRWIEFAAALRSWKTALALGASTVLVSVNWFLFIWAINSGHILQTSLGYYICPLVNVLLGVVFLKERLRRLQVIALILATISVLLLTLRFGAFPWVSLSLAFSFGFYGLIRKIAPVGALVGLTVETLVLSLPSLVYLVAQDVAGSGSFVRAGARTSLLLMGAALVTALPLLLFTVGARRLHYATIGFLQYIAPSCTFLVATIIYGEPLKTGQLAAFALIWTALALYSVDAAGAYRRNGKTLEQTVGRMAKS